MLSNKVERTRPYLNDIHIAIATVALVFLGGIVLQLLFLQGDDIGNYKLEYAFAQGPQGGNYTYGVLASVQNDESGEPFWIVSGNWRTNLLGIANQSQAATLGNMSQQGTSAPVFNTSVRMISFNGTGEHTHSITNFALESVTMPSNMTTIFNGTSTANFREGPITDILATITFTNDKVISIWLDPAKINYHYGNTPIYGVAVKEMH
jgi:hypothetical protein